MDKMKNLLAMHYQAPLREPAEVMNLERMGCFHQTRLSFMRQLLRRISKERWSFSKPVWEISTDGYGTAVYTMEGLSRIYSLVAFSHYLPDSERSDRVIATAWDVTFTLYDGIPNRGEIDRLLKNVPYQEEGRLSSKELVLGRANKSLRLWNKVVASLAKGLQPELSDVEEVGYLMRTTAVYGSGKFGLNDRAFIENREELASPFQAEMLAVYLVRCFVLDLVEFVALKRGGNLACRIEPKLKKRFGIGNSTGLGMAPFLVNHPRLLNQWIEAREISIARVRSVKEISSEKARLFSWVLVSAQENALNWLSEHPIQMLKLEDLRNDLQKTKDYFDSLTGSESYPWDTMYHWATKNISLEAQEALFSLMLEPYSELVDEMSKEMSVEENKYFRIDGSLECKAIKKLIENSFSWALAFDYSRRKGQARFWYVSEEKLEPRLGERFEEEGADLEQPLAVGRDIKELYDALGKCLLSDKLADFLIDNPKFRHTVRRILETKDLTYGEIRDNLIAFDMKPIDMLRCKLSFFGADRFDPRSDRWVRICMYQNAQFPNELLEEYDDFWPYSATENHK